MIKKYAKRIISTLMTGVMVFGSGITAFAEDPYGTMLTGTVYHSGVKLNIDSNFRAVFLTWNGNTSESDFAPYMVSWENPANGSIYPGYCINPAYKGYGDVSVAYDLDIEKFDDDCIVDAGGSGGSGKTAGSPSSAGNSIAHFLEGAVVHGFPTVSAEKLLKGTASSYGVSQDVLEYAAYLATKMAIWSGIHDIYGIDSWQINEALEYPYELKAAVLAATHNIYNAAGSYTPYTGVTRADFKASEPKLTNDGTYEIIYTIQNTADQIVEEDMFVEMTAGGSFPSDMKIQLMDGSTPQKTTTSSGKERYVIPGNTKQIKVIVPDPKEAGRTENLTLYVKYKGKILLYGRSSQERTQNYVLAGDLWLNPFNEFKIEPEGIETPPSDPPTPSDIPTSGVTIQKVEKGTTKGLAGAEFKVTRLSHWEKRLVDPDFDDGEDPNPDEEDSDDVEEWFEIVETEELGTHVTDASGRISLNLSPGRIKVEEIVPPDGYSLSDNNVQILDIPFDGKGIDGGAALKLTFENPKDPDLKIEKIDKQTGSKITATAVFKVEQVDGSYTTTVETKSGVATLDGLPVGTYKITEVKAPEGYVLDTCPGSVHLAGDTSVTYTAYNLKTPVVTIEKIDKQTGDPVPGTRFEIKRSDGTKIGTVETGRDGTVTVGMKNGDLGYLQPGTYTITEVFVPEPYVLTGEHQDIQLNAGDEKTLLFANLEQPQITVEKYDEQTGEPLEGAQFAIYEQADLSRPVVEGMTDRKGKLTTGYIAPGTYVVRELNPPPGYMFSDKTNPDRMITAKAGDGEIIVKVDNIKLPELTIKKIDSVTKEPIQGVTYRIGLVDDSSVKPATATTDKKGIITLPELAAGTYEITEISTPHPYILNPTTQTVKLVGGDVKTLLFENTKYPTLVVRKTDATTMKGIPNTTYRIQREDVTGGIVTLGTYKTDKNGEIILPYVEPGWYIITETLPAQGYQLPTNPVTRVYLAPGDNSYDVIMNAVTGSTAVVTSPTTKPSATAPTISAGNSVLAAGVTVTSGANYAKVGDVVNYPLNSLVIKKADANTGEMLAGATFEVVRVTGETSGQNGKVIATVTTDKSGVVVMTGLEAGGYTVREIIPPQNYIISETNMQSVNMKADGTSIVEIIFRNHPYGAISIDKVDGDTRQPLEGAKFKITKPDGTIVGEGIYISDASGNILIPNLEPGSYVITEIEAPEGYAAVNEPMTVQIGTTGGTISKVFSNYKKGSLQIRKLDAVTKEPLGGATFKVERTDGTVVGTGNGLYTTDKDGTILLPLLDKGVYVVTEISPPDGYSLGELTRKTMEIYDTGKTYNLDFYNDPLASLTIRKFDADTKALLANARFRITHSDGTVVAGGANGVFTTDESGTITLSNIKADTYTVTEITAPDGYALSENPTQTIKVGTVGTFKLDFYNKALGNLVIRKFDANTSDPLAGAQFTVKNIDGTLVGTGNGIFTTDASGIITLPKLAKGTYVITETKAPKGYALSEVNSQTITIDNEKTYTADFYNLPLKGVQIIKKDSQTGLPLAGAQFQIWQTGASSSTSVSSASPAGNLIGTYTTDSNGIISVVLEEGTYEIVETKAPAGYQIDNNKQDIVVRDGEQTTVTFTNTPILGLQILKVDSSTQRPLQGATFKVTKSNGELIGTYRTDAAGEIMLPKLESGTYIVTEVNAPSGYVLDSTPKTVTVAAGKVTTVTFQNSKKGGVVIQKLDSATEKPIEGCEFLITTFNGDTVGRFTTDRAGQIHLPNLTDGTYIAKETKAPAGYNLAAPKSFQISSGTNRYMEGTSGQKTITIYNDPLGVSQIIKTDAVTGKPVAGAVYVIAALNSGTGRYGQTVYAQGENASNITVNGLHTILGRYTTSENGIINIHNLPEGWYTLQEETAPAGYERDATVYNFQITGNGDPTIIRLTNKPLMGRIALTKLSADYNHNTGWDSGTPLTGAVYSVLDSEGIEVDRLITGSDGTAISGKLKVGTYTLKEIQAPDWYGITSGTISVTIKKDGQVVSVVAKDPSINLMVGIKKTSDTKTCYRGDTINYYITGVGNESNVSLDKFTVHDKLPDVKAAQIKYLDTGLWSKKYNFKVAYTTNMNTAYTYLPGMYTSDKHNHIDLLASNMGLRKDEYVTQIKLEFQGAVAPGFKLVEAMSMQMVVNAASLSSGYQFTNYADVSGRWHDQIVTANSHWTITLYSSGSTKKLPKTGW